MDENHLRVEFLIQDDPDKLLSAVCNALSLGHFELPRALLSLLYPILPNKVNSLLDDLISHGIPHNWLNTKEVPSSGHMRWLCLTLREELSSLHVDRKERPYYMQCYLANVLDSEVLATTASVSARELVKELIEFDVLLSSILHQGANLAASNPILSNSTIYELRSVMLHGVATYSGITTSQLSMSPNLSVLPAYLRGSKHAVKSNFQSALPSASHFIDKRRFLVLSKGKEYMG
jgi:hypothetical protein